MSNWNFGMKILVTRKRQYCQASQGLGGSPCLALVRSDGMATEGDGTASTPMVFESRLLTFNVRFKRNFRPRVLLSISLGLTATFSVLFLHLRLYVLLLFSFPPLSFSGISSRSKARLQICDLRSCCSIAVRSAWSWANERQVDLDY
jgi:hypothetical protein